MQFISTKAEKNTVSFKEAVLHCLPPEGGLYVPASTVDLRQFFLYMDENTSYPELVSTVIPSLLEGEFNPFSAARVAESAFVCEPVVRRLDDNLAVLELFNGPTGTFKDFGLSFLSTAMEEILKQNGRATTLTATSGASGASVAQAFAGRRGITAVILYPACEIRGLDPQVLVHNGGNILPIRVDGTFDDCQRLIREAFTDDAFVTRYGLTSSNTINIGRLMPQVFYFLYSFIKLKKFIKGNFIFSIPTGNLGNLIAGLYAWKFGMPVHGFMAAMNNNAAISGFLSGQPFIPRPAIKTFSPSMDVGNPSNMERLSTFYQEAPSVMRNMVFQETVDDDATVRAMKDAYDRYGLLLDPHGAVAYAAARRLVAKDSQTNQVVFLATGHPARHAAIVEMATGQSPEPCEALQALSRVVQPEVSIPPLLEALELVVAGSY